MWMGFFNGFIDRMLQLSWFHHAFDKRDTKPENKVIFLIEKDYVLEIYLYLYSSISFSTSGSIVGVYWFGLAKTNSLHPIRTNISSFLKFLYNTGRSSSCKITVVTT